MATAMDIIRGNTNSPTTPTQSSNSAMDIIRNYSIPRATAPVTKTITPTPVQKAKASLGDISSTIAPITDMFGQIGEGVSNLIKNVTKNVSFEFVTPKASQIYKQAAAAIAQPQTQTIQSITIKPGAKKVDLKQLEQITGTKTSTSATIKPEMKRSGNVENVFLNVSKQFPQTSEEISKLISDPLTLKANPTKLFNNFIDIVKTPVVDAINEEKTRIQNLFKPSKSTSETIGKGLKVVAGGAAVPFSLLTSFFSVLDEIPALGSVSKLINIPFAFLGEGGTNVSNLIVDNLPISKQDKSNIREGMGEVFALAAQLYGGKLMEVGAKKKAELVKKYGEQDANIIVQKAKEIAQAKEKKGNIESKLPQGEVTPQEVINTVIREKAENTTEGKAIIKNAVEAQQRGQNIVVKKTVEPIKESSVNTLSTKATNSLENKPEGIKPKAVENAKIEIQQGTKPPVKIREIEGGKVVIEDGRHHLQAAKELGINNYPIEDVTKFYNKQYKGDITKKLVEKEVGVSRANLPVGEGKEKVSKLEARVNKTIGNISQSDIDRLGLSTYKQMNKKENITKASEYVVNKPEEALKVLTGEIEAPQGILRNSIYVAMQNLANGDVELARKLASISSTRLGQELSILTEIDKESPVGALKDIIKVREEVFKKRYGDRTVKQVKDAEVEKIKKQIKKPDRYDWSDFINSIDTC